MQVSTKKQTVMEGQTIVKELFFLTIKNEKGQEVTLNVGAKTYTGVNTLLGKNDTINEKAKTK